MLHYVKAKLPVKLMGLYRLIQGKNVIMGTDMAQPPSEASVTPVLSQGRWASLVLQRSGFVQKGLIASSRPQIKQKQLVNF